MIRNEGRQECDKRWWIRYKTNENDKAWEQKEDFDVKVMIGESESRRRRRKEKWMKVKWETADTNGEGETLPDPQGAEVSAWERER